ncbi:MAG: DUF420 domain-containing protein [Candidatus Hydrogenedentota bacterium]|nr:MAG: DUF420 domain-containing protein [Candidatus Hydrogenedentota bacterium]
MTPESLTFLPTLNACFNASSAALVLLAWWAIRRGNKLLHIWCMCAALVSSALFLSGYLIYHAYHGTTRFEGPPAIRFIYLAILLTHTLLAMAVVPLVLGSVVFAIRRRFDRHKRLARVTLPIWLYVSVTGVIIYWMLYHLAPALRG